MGADGLLAVNLFMKYSLAEKRLLALGDEVLTMKFGLRTMRALLRSLGSPHHRFQSIHVAGTNGKGSVCALLESVLRAAGYRVGLFTSPHLISLRERMRVNGRMIGPVDFVKSYEQVIGAIQQLQQTKHLTSHPTYFETITAIAFDYFARQKIDVAVVEVGMGGRLDSTNLIKPLASVITNIDFDHERFLGNTIEQIAAEKAGIIKPNVPVLTAARRLAAVRVMEGAARVNNSPLIQCLRDSRISNIQLKPTGSRFSLRTPEHWYPHLEIPLAGHHQLENAVLAVRTLEECSQRGLQVFPEHIIAGLRSVQWPGRFEKISDHPAIFLDGAHNPAGARALRVLMESVQRNRKLILIYGAMRDKAIRKVFKELLPVCHQVIFTQPPVLRAASPEEIFSAAGEPGCPSFLVPDVPQALKLARQLARQNTVILVTGSLYLVGKVREILKG